MRKLYLLFCLSAILVVATLYLSVAGSRPDAELIHEARAVARQYKEEAGRPRYVTLIDYRRSLLAQRLTVVDTRGPGRVVLRARVSHAWSSGLLYATRFSDVAGSEQSSRGVFITQSSYTGRFGPSLRVRGLNSGLNTHALPRGIVFHPGYTWSAGCFMTAPDVNSRLVALLQHGTLVAVLP